MPTINSLTTAQREKFKCTFLWFRPYVEDVALFISVLFVLFSLLIFIVHMRTTKFVQDEIFMDKIYLSTTLSIIINIFIIIAVFTRVAAFLWPFIILQTIGILINGKFLLILALSVIGTFIHTIEGKNDVQKYRIEENNFIISTNTFNHNIFYQFENLNGFVVLGLLFRFQLWIFSIIWLSYNAIKFEQITKKLIEEQQKKKMEERINNIRTSTSKIANENFIV